MDLPLSRPLLKWMCGKPLETADIMDLNPFLGEFIRRIGALVLQKHLIEEDSSLSAEQCAAALEELHLTYPGTGKAHEVRRGVVFAWVAIFPMSIELGCRGG